MGRGAGGGRGSVWATMLGASALTAVLASCGLSDHQPPANPPAPYDSHASQPPGRGKPDGHTPESPPPPRALCRGDGWCWENPLPHGNELRGVWTAPRGAVPGSNDTFAVGALGIIQRRHAGGWIVDDSGVSVTLNGVWGSAGNDVWAVGDAGTIVHFDGARWATVASGATSDLTSVWGVSAHDAWIGGLGDTLLHLTDEGWVAVAPALAGSDVHAVFGTAANDVWAAGERRVSTNKSAIVMRWNGDAWTDALVTEPFPAADGAIIFESVWASRPTDVWVGGVVSRRGAAVTFGTMMHFDGNAWAGAGLSDDQLLERPITSIFGATATDVWGPGLHWDGKTWSTVLAERTAGVVAIHGRATDDVVGVGRGGRVIHFDGSTWEDWDASLTDDGIVDAWGAANGELYAVTSTLILHHDGRGWSRAFHGPGAAFVAVWGSSPNNVVFLREDGEHLVWDGAVLSRRSPPDGLTAAYQATDVWASGPDDIWITASGRFGAGNGRVIRSQPSGERWLQVLSTPGSLERIAGSGANDVWVVGTDAAVQHFYGASWTTIAVPANLHRALSVSSPTDVWLSGFNAPVLHWDGTAFTQVPPAPGSRSFAVNAMWSNGPNDAWIAGDTIAHWDGEAWTESATSVSGLPFWQAIWQTPDGKVRVFGDGGAILRK